MRPNERKYHHDVPIDDLSDRTALARIREILGGNYRGRQLVTLTVQMYNSGRLDPEFNRVLREAELVLPESTGLKLFSQVFPPTFGKISGGAYLARDVVDICAEEGKRVAIFGTTPDNRSLAAQSLRRRFSYDNIHTIDGDYQFGNPTDSRYVAEKLDLIRPDFAIMAGDEVKAERWINEWIVNSDVNVKLVGNFRMMLNHEAGTRWVPPLPIHNLGISWLLLYPGRTPERRKEYTKGLFTLANFALNDLSQNLRLAGRPITLL